MANRLLLNTKAAQYAELNRTWKTGDVVELDLSMPVTLIESNPLVEETRNQMAVKRGPLFIALNQPICQKEPTCLILLFL